ncbi:MAG TPA: bis-aminopropyl spermidine synthase family protein [Streptosporangiaceae bacterium]|nr:bis-aminopropyl spermidine synthase family protein [Streptosporangiaceae bacterium]
MNVDAIAAEVAAAVGLAEGPAGVIDVLRVIAREEPVATRDLARGTELPVPIVTAVCNELRKRGVVDRSRPVRLTPAGREALAGTAGTGQPGLRGQCPHCEGLGLTVPDSLAALVPALETVAAGVPAAKLGLDQTHCTVVTKLLRVLRMHEAGALGGRRIILLGDDDLVSVAIAAFAESVGPSARPSRLAVVDTDPDLLGYLGAELARFGVAAEVIEHDLRQPLLPGLLGGFDVACTDPPYTVEGARLFLSRAVSALADGGGAHVFFSFGARRPEETLETQILIAEMGLVVRSLVPGFNHYEGAGILGGTSHLYHLRTTPDSEPVLTGEHSGPLYTADSRVAAVRPYRCAGCGAVHLVGPGVRWPHIADLKSAGCPECGGTVMRPKARSSVKPADLRKAMDSSVEPADPRKAMDSSVGPADLSEAEGSTVGPADPGEAEGSAVGPADLSEAEGSSIGPAGSQGSDNSKRRVAAPSGAGGPAVSAPLESLQSHDTQLAAARFRVRPAGERDLDAIAAFEVEIARVSFGDEAVDDPALHRKRVAAALGKAGEVTLVAEVAAGEGPGRPVGWAWLSGRTNSLTGDRYGNFRSLATADVPGRSEVAELLMAAVLSAASEAGYSHLTGKVHAGNLGMRTLYAKFGFHAAHLTMERRPGEDQP